MPGVPCSSCGGQDGEARRKCESCRGSGIETYRGCPSEMLTRETLELLFWIDCADQGNWPVAGGMLDQSQWFVDVVRFARICDQQCREAMKRHAK